MTFDEIEALIRRYLSTGIAVVVILGGPVTGDRAGLPTGDPVVVTVGPDGSLTSAAPTLVPGDGPAGGPAASGGTSRTSRSGSTVESSGSGAPDRTDDPAGPDPTSDSGGSAGGAGSGRSAGDRTGSGPTTGESGQDGGNGGSGERAARTGADGVDPDRGDQAGGSAGSDAGSGDGAGTPSDGARADDPAGGAAGAGDAEHGSGGTGARDLSAGPGTTAAARHGWGTPARVEEFSDGVGDWNVYDGPGHAGKGIRSPSAVSLADGILTITGDAAGKTAGMAWNPGQKYGRWEGRVRAPASDPSYNALLLLWPDAEDFPVGGEIDFMEMLDHTRQRTDLFLHFGAGNSQVHGEVEVDATQWHNWALEWTPEAITAYVDGEQWYRSTETTIFPPGPMHLCIQLDWFPTGGGVRQSWMEVDWVRQYLLDSSGADPAATGDAGSGGRHDDQAAEPAGVGGPPPGGGGTPQGATPRAAGTAPAGVTDGSTRQGSDRDGGDRAPSPALQLLRRMFGWGGGGDG